MRESAIKSQIIRARGSGPAKAAKMPVSAIQLTNMVTKTALLSNLTKIRTSLWLYQALR